MLVAGRCSAVRILVAPAIIGEAVILKASLPELARRTATFRALEGACMAWRLDMGDLQVQWMAILDYTVSIACGADGMQLLSFELAARCGVGMVMHHGHTEMWFRLASDFCVCILLIRSWLKSTLG